MRAPFSRTTAVTWVRMFVEVLGRPEHVGEKVKRHLDVPDDFSLQSD